MGGKPVQAHDVFKKMAFYIGLSHYGVLATTTTLQGGKHLLKNNSHVYHMHVSCDWVVQVPIKVQGF